MEFDKQSWDKTHFETIKELHPEMSDDEVKKFVEEESKSADWLAYEEAFKRKLATYSYDDLKRMMQGCDGDVDKFNNLFFGIKNAGN